MTKFLFKKKQNRYFDFDGPLVFGKSPNNRPADWLQSFEGCIGDIYINERLSNLHDDLLAENNTQAGCPAKLDKCRTQSEQLRTQCSKCSHQWSHSVRCECRSGDDYELLGDEQLYCAMRKADQVVTLADNGYLSLNERQMNSDILRVEFGVKMRPPANNASSTALLNMRFVNIVSEHTLQLLYDWSADEMRLMGDQTTMIRVRKNRILDDEYWTRIELELHRGGLARLVINGLFRNELRSRYVDALFGQKFNLKWSIHGPGCIRGIRVNNDPSFGYRPVNSIRGVY